MAATAPVVPEWTLGDRFAKSREYAGLTQAEIAVELTVRGIKTSESAVAAWERDRNQPRRLYTVVRVWADITSVNADWLLGSLSQNVKYLKLLGGATSTQPALPGLGPGPALTLLAPYEHSARR